MKYRTELFKKLKEETVLHYNDDGWSYAKRWRTRVGIPRLVADAAAGQASGLIESIFKGVHQNEPELAALLEAACEATNAYATALALENWRRYRAGEK